MRHVKPPRGLRPKVVVPQSGSAAAKGLHRPDRLAAARRVVVRVLAFTIFAVTVSMSVLSLQHEPAEAIPGMDEIECAATPEYYGRGPEQVEVGAESFLAPSKGSRQNINWDDQGSYTLYEELGVRGASWSGTEFWQDDRLPEVNGDEDKKKCDIMATATSEIGQIIFDASRTITSATITLRQNATDASPFLTMIRGMTPEVETMRQNLFLPGAVIVVMLTGFWVIGKAHRPDGRRAVVQGVIWSVMCMLVVGWLLMPSNEYTGGGQQADPNYLWAAENINETTSEALGALSTALFPEASTDGICGLDKGVDNRGARMLDCSIYKTLVFDPWVKGQFGSLGDDGAVPYEPISNKSTNNELPKDMRDDMRVAQLHTQAVSHPEDSGDRPKREVGDGNSFNPDTKTGRWNLIRASMWEHYNDDYAMWKGDQADARVSAAFGALVASILVGLFVCATSLLTMIWHAVVVVLFVLLPIVGLVSIHPLQQKLLKGWFQQWAMAVALGLIFAIGQILSLVIVGGVLQSGASMGWKCLIMVVMVFALWKIVQAAREGAFTPNFGGQQLFDVDQLARDATQKGRGGFQRGRRVVTSRRARSAAGAAAGAARRDAGGVVGGVAGGARGAYRPMRGRVKAAGQKTDRRMDKMQKDYSNKHGERMSDEELKRNRRIIRFRETGKETAKGAVGGLGGGLRGGVGGAVDGAQAAAADRSSRSGVVSGAKAGGSAGGRVRDGVQRLEKADARRESRRAAREMKKERPTVKARVELSDKEIEAAKKRVRERLKNGPGRPL